MKKELINKIDAIINSKKMALLSLIVMLFMLIMVIVLGYTNERLENQIIERDIQIRQLQYTDSVAHQLLDYVQKDSSTVLVTRWKNGHHQTYKEIAEERDSITQKYYGTKSEIQKLNYRIELYEEILKKLQKHYPFEYKIVDGKNETMIELKYTDANFNK